MQLVDLLGDHGIPVALPVCRLCRVLQHSPIVKLYGLSINRRTKLLIRHLLI